MRLRSRSVIARPAAKVWPYIIRPEYFQRWNDKPMRCTTIATEIQEGRIFELRYSNLIGPGIRPDMEVRERITLDELAGTTRVTKVVTIRNHGAAWYWIVLIWLIGNFGTRVESDLLQEMCERDA